MSAKHEEELTERLEAMVASNDYFGYRELLTAQSPYLVAQLLIRASFRALSRCSPAAEQESADGATSTEVLAMGVDELVHALGSIASLRIERWREEGPDAAWRVGIEWYANDRDPAFICEYPTLIEALRATYQHRDSWLSKVPLRPLRSL